ncbi:subclass B3 metallo-beta-lactamase [Tahibacter harae]|uniref:Subclass B3 metallo-beta-lactamase n=1 Tax=Tahibacter harae TaxID=2963937 RepID=A0ABT1QYH3_9GAMM|nr:subclass B3 metallo-beta-lactamase [Tahibacter harae]MCQ4167331.1 subclass B3 metallo-beta-lactamase [Tahibacter harae]
MSLLRFCLAALCAGLAASVASAAELKPDPPKNCRSCAEWNQPAEPYPLFGNTWYVGSAGLSSVLITSDQGHILIGGGLAETAPLIAANIVKLGFRLEDVKIIATSHGHYDHIGGVAALARASGARVIASPRTAEALRAGTVPADDPQAAFGAEANAFPKISKVDVVRDQETVNLGPLQLTARFTPGHTPGATSWSWRSCNAGTCRDLVYADSLNPVSDDEYRYADHPAVVKGFRASIAAVAALPCDIMIPAHPGFADLPQKLARRRAGETPDPFVDPGSCKRYAEAAAQNLDKRLATEKTAK